MQFPAKPVCKATNSTMEHQDCQDNSRGLHLVKSVKNWPDKYKMQMLCLASMDFVIKEASVISPQKIKFSALKQHWSVFLPSSFTLSTARG
jgi:hypothetical protein